MYFISVYSVLNIVSEYTHEFYISKNITSYTFLLVLKIVESLQCIFKTKILHLASIHYYYLSLKDMAWHALTYGISKRRNIYLLWCVHKVFSVLVRYVLTAAIDQGPSKNCYRSVQKCCREKERVEKKNYKGNYKALYVNTKTR